MRAYSHKVPRKARRLAIPAPADFRSQDEEALGSSSAQFRIGGVLAAFGRAERRPVRLRGAGLGLSCAAEWGNQCCVTAQGPSAWRGAVHHKVQASSVVRADAGRRGVSQPLLRDDLAVRPNSLARDPDPSSLDSFCPSGKQTCAGAGKRVVP